MKFGQLIEYNMINIYLNNHTQNVVHTKRGGAAIPRPLSKK